MVRRRLQFLPVKMPTPESEMFLARKPTVPPTFDGVDYDDTKRLKQAQDAILREQWVQAMMRRLVGEELGKCYFREGVNHLEKCGKYRGTRVSVSAMGIGAGFCSDGTLGPLATIMGFFHSCLPPARTISTAPSDVQGQGVPGSATKLLRQTRIPGEGGREEVGRELTETTSRLGII